VLLAGDRGTGGGEQTSNGRPVVMVTHLNDALPAIVRGLVAVRRRRRVQVERVQLYVPRFVAVVRVVPVVRVVHVVVTAAVVHGT